MSDWEIGYINTYLINGLYLYPKSVDEGDIYFVDHLKPENKMNSTTRNYYLVTFGGMSL